jgi:hypothetical protein
MRGRDAVHVIDFAVGGESSVEIAAVPRGNPLGTVGGIFGRDIGAAVDAVGLAHAVAAAALGHRLALLDHARAVFLAGERSRAMGKHSAASRQGADTGDAAES